MAGSVAPSPTRRRTPVHLWIVGVVTLLWNSIGAVDYLMTHLRVEAYMASFTPEQMAYFYSFPTWAVGAWALGVWFSVAGSAALLLRSRWAVYLFGISLVGLAGTTLYTNVLTDGMAAMGGSIGYVIFSVAIWLIGIGLLVYSIAMTRRGVLR